MAPERFHIQVEETVLEDLKTRLDHARWPDAWAGDAWEGGTDLAALRSLAGYWRTRFDWRAQEAALNRLAQYRSRIGGIDVHFVHERGAGPEPLPIILTHGWPDSYLRYQKVIPLLADPAAHGGDPADAFDVVVPSVPGFGFSSRPETGGINNQGISELWATLMTDILGYRRFAAGGGDVGSGVTRYLASGHPDRLVGIHLTDLGIVRDLVNAPDPTLLSGAERDYQREARAWIAREGAYMAVQSTRPQTLAFGLTDSPVGLAAWILYKFRSWSDCHGDLADRFTADELLTNIMLYWIAGNFGSSARLYYENARALPPLPRIEVPTGVALFAADILPPPRDWAERHFNVQRWTKLPRGGHFTAWEEPELWVEDVRAFFRPLRRG